MRHDEIIIGQHLMFHLPAGPRSREVKVVSIASNHIWVKTLEPPIIEIPCDASFLHECFPLLHVYAQVAPRAPHPEVFIVGTRTGLVALAEAIRSALDGAIGLSAAAECLTTDGEGYDVFVVLEPEEHMNAYLVPHIANAYIVDHSNPAWPKKGV